METIMLLSLASHKYRSNDDLIADMYGDRVDGGPVWAIESLRQVVLRLRRKLFVDGIAVVSRFGCGYEMHDICRRKLRLVGEWV
jgi:hypothetical protein